MRYKDLLTRACDLPTDASPVVLAEKLFQTVSVLQSGCRFESLPEAIYKLEKTIERLSSVMKENAQEAKERTNESDEAATLIGIAQETRRALVEQYKASAQ